MKLNRFGAFLALLAPLAFAACDDLFGSGDSGPGVLETTVPDVSGPRSEGIEAS